MVTQTLTCRHCESENIVKNGKAPNSGKQKFLCHDCGRQSRENPGSNVHSRERREEILRAYQERAYRRGLCYTDLATSGKRTGRSSPKSDTRPWARKAERRRTSRGGTTP